MAAVGARAARTASPTPVQDRERPVAAQPRIAGLSVVDSPVTVTQQEALQRLGLAGDEFAERIFARCGVERRQLDLSDEFLGQTLQGRTARVEDQLRRHAIDAIDQLEIDPLQIGTVLSASLYSTGCPTLAHRLVDHYRMHSATDKYHIVGVGCASAVPLLRLAAQALSADPRRQALVVAAESMSSILRQAGPGDARAKTVGSAIFGDGCAAAVLSRDPAAPGPAIVDSAVHQIAGTQDAVRLTLAPQDSYLHLARELPELAGEGLSELVDGLLARNDLDRDAVAHWIVHPGGRRIVESIQHALALSDDEVAISWQALRDHGNVGTPSIFYVLRSTMRQRDPRPGERGLVVTIGPGVTVGMMLLAW